LTFFEATVTKIDILNPELILPDDYQQMKKYAKIILFGIKPIFEKISYVIFISQPFLCQKIRSK